MARLNVTWKGYLIFMMVIVLTFILALFFGCGSIPKHEVDFESLYKIELNKNLVLSSHKDKLEELIPVETINYKREYLIQLLQIDSLKRLIAFKDSNMIIVLNSIQTGLENLSDEGYFYLDELRKK